MKYDLCVHEIGAKDAYRDPKDVAERVFVLAVREPPEAPFMVTIGGYDDDPRELFDIPEAMEFAKVFFNRIAELDTGGVLARRLHSDLTPFALLALGLVTRDQIVINPKG